jgi:hypothetical protein
MVLAAQLAAVIVSAIGIIATIIWNRAMIKRRATLDMLLSEQTNEVRLAGAGEAAADPPAKQGLRRRVGAQRRLRRDSHSCHRWLYLA